MASHPPGKGQSGGEDKDEIPDKKAEEFGSHEAHYSPNGYAIMAPP